MTERELSPLSEGRVARPRPKGWVRGVTIEAALRSFSEHGYEGTSLRKIAKEVGVQPPSLYNHFPSKEDLLWAIVEDAITELEEQQELALEGVESPVPQLQAFVSSHVTWHGCNARKARVVNARWYALSKQRYEYVRAFRDRYEQRLRTILVAGVGLGAFDIANIRLTSYGILQMGMGIANWYQKDGQIDIDELRDCYTDLALRMAIRRQ